MIAFGFEKLRHVVLLEECLQVVGAARQWVPLFLGLHGQYACQFRDGIWVEVEDVRETAGEATIAHKEVVVNVCLWVTVAIVTCIELRWVSDRVQTNNTSALY